MYNSSMWLCTAPASIIVLSQFQPSVLFNCNYSCIWDCGSLQFGKIPKWVLTDFGQDSPNQKDCDLAPKSIDQPHSGAHKRVLTTKYPIWMAANQAPPIAHGCAMHKIMPPIWTTQFGVDDFLNVFQPLHHRRKFQVKAAYELFLSSALICIIQWPFNNQKVCKQTPPWIVYFWLTSVPWPPLGPQHTPLSYRQSQVLRRSSCDKTCIICQL